MKKDIASTRNAIIFVLILIALIMISNRIIESGFNPHLIKEKEAWSQISRQGPIEYLIIGDSHAEFIYPPSNNTYNIAIGSDSYREMYYLTKDIINKSKVKDIIIEIDMNCFYRHKSILDSSAYLKKYLSLEEMQKMNDESFISLLIRSQLSSSGFMTKKIAADEQDRVYRNIVSNPDRNISLNAKNRVKTQFGKGFNPMMIKYFFKIIELAKRKDVGIILIEYPHTKEFNYEFESMNKSREKFYSILFSEINKTTEKYIVLDYYNRFFNNSRYFMDSDHMNETTAISLSAIIKEDIIEKTTQKQSQ